MTAYFPKGRWFDYRNVRDIAHSSVDHVLIHLQGTELNSDGQYVTLDAPMDYIPLHVLGGAVIPQQEPSTTTTLRYCLYVGLCNHVLVVMVYAKLELNSCNYFKIISHLNTIKFAKGNLHMYVCMGLF